MTCGAQANETLARLREIGCPTAMVNSDARVIEPCLHTYPDLYGQRLQEFEYWSAQQLTDQDRAFLRIFQPTNLRTLDEQITLLAYHGSPRSFLQRIGPIAPTEQLDEYFADSPAAQILVGGHIQQQFFLRYGDRLILNPGSVGLPMDRMRARTETGVRNPPWGEYAIVHSEGNQFSVELIRVPFAVEQFLTLLTRRGMPQTEWLVYAWSRV